MLTSPERDRLASLFGALGSASDLANGFHAEKAIRTAIVATRLAEAHGLDSSGCSDAYFLALLRFLGCTAFAHEEAHIYGGGDDISVRSVMGFADPSEPGQLVHEVIVGVGRGVPLARRVRGVATLLTHPAAAAAHAHAQCDVAAALARQLGMPKQVLTALGDLFERWDGKGHPSGLLTEAIPVLARIVAAADILEIAYSRHQLAGAVDTAKKRSGGRFDPAVATTFCANASRIVEGLGGASVWDNFVAAEPEPHRQLSPALLDRFAAAFARVVDLKSVWTSTHSYGVGTLAQAAGIAAGLDDQTVSQLRVAGWLHDLGRLAVSNLVWDKPGPLNEAEREVVRLHAYHSERLLARSPVLASVALLVGATHERCDGSGYPKGLRSGALGEAARLLAAADVFWALLEERPYRRAYSPDEAAAILAGEAGRGRLDLAAVRHVLDAAGLVGARVRAAWPAGLSDREVDVLRLVARGATNKDVARVLGISAKTVQHHVAHIFTKVGVASRAGAALFAAEHELIGPDPP